MQYVTRYNLKPDKESEFRQWVLDNSSAIAENAPDGWSYLGTWFTVRLFGQYECESRWEIDDYAALGAGFGNEIMQRLWREWMEFSDLSRDSEGCLMKSAEDVDILSR